MAWCGQGQMHIECQLCHNEPKIKWKCIECDILMCSTCKEKRHSKIKTVREHTVIDIKDIGHPQGQERKSLHGSSVICQLHREKICDVLCKTCVQPICKSCVTQTHSSHDVVDLDGELNMRINLLVREKKKIELEEEILLIHEDKLSKIKAKENADYNSLKRDIHNHEIALKKSIQKCSQNLTLSLEKKWREDQVRIKAKENKFDEERAMIEKRKKKLQHILSNYKSSSVLKDIFELEETSFKTMPQGRVTDFELPVFVPGDLEAISKTQFGTLQTAKALESLIQDSDVITTCSVVKKYETSLSDITFLEASWDGFLWFGTVASNFIPHGGFHKIRPDGDKVKIVSSFDVTVIDITITPRNDILFIDENTSTIKQIKARSKEILNTNFKDLQLNPTCIHATLDGQVVIGGFVNEIIFLCIHRAIQSRQGAVVIVNLNGKVNKDYNLNRRITSFPSIIRKITTTANGNIFAIDHSRTNATIVVLGQDKIINTYTDNSSNKSFPFCPSDFAVSLLDNVVLCKADNHKLHILDNNGNLITTINSKEKGLLYPFSPTFTASGQLYIGCSTAKDGNEDEENKALLCKVNLTGI